MRAKAGCCSRNRTSNDYSPDANPGDASGITLALYGRDERIRTSYKPNHGFLHGSPVQGRPRMEEAPCGTYIFLFQPTNHRPQAASQADTISLGREISSLARRLNGMGN